MFRAGLLLQALQRARGGTATDEAMAVEAMGLKPRLVTGNRENIKITWPEDLAMAEGILARRAGDGEVDP
jgi:2-C-methyl-D-erythritol 4-phosphate cytidylyltransferase